MKLQTKIILISFSIAIIAALLFSWFDSSHKATSDYLLSFGITGFFGGLLQAVVGLFLLLKTDKRYAQGFLMSGGLLMVIGFTTCTGAFSGY
jgi:hypothetical protein